MEYYIPFPYFNLILTKNITLKCTKTSCCIDSAMILPENNGFRFSCLKMRLFQTFWGIFTDNSKIVFSNTSKIVLANTSKYSQLISFSDNRTSCLQPEFIRLNSSDCNKILTIVILFKVCEIWAFVYTIIRNRQRFF